MNYKYPLNVAVIGTGMVAGTHLQALADLHERVTLNGVLSRSARNAQEFAARAGQLTGSGVSTYSDIRAVCNDEELDFAIVLTPPNARTALVEALATAGKHILMEKPVERNSSAATAIVNVCAQHTIKLGIVFQHRMRSSSRKLAALIDDAALGKLHIAEILVPWWRDQGYYDEPGRGTYERDGGGVLISQAIHSLDLALSLTGPVNQVQAMATKTALHTMEAEDYVTAGLRFANGAVGSLIASTASYPGDAESITLHFDRAVAHLQSGELKLHWRDGRIEQFGETSATGGGADPMAFTHEWHRDIIEDFASAIVNDHQPAAPGQSALLVHSLIDALIESSRSGKKVAL